MLASAPPYQTNPAHDPKDPSYNPNKTPEPPDAQSVYQAAERGDLGTWYGLGQNGWYRFFSDNAGTVHFAGVVPENQVPILIRRGQ
jgi:filamentous hemagglutinin